MTSLLPGAPSSATGGGLDVLTQNMGEVARRAQAKGLAADLVTAIFRIVKLSTLHSIDNQAMVRQVEDTVALVHDYGQRTEHNVSILFAHGSVFVGGQLLRANRGVYEGALELGEILAKVGAAEIGIMRDARAEDFTALASSLADALRSAKPKRVDRPSPKIRLRSFNAAALGREGAIEERLDPAAQVARTYASAVVIMRRFFEELRRGKYELPQRVKRVAQRLVDLSTGETPAFLGVTAARNQNHDQAGRAVNAAILSLSMARQITTDMVLLSRIAMAALLYDVARARAAGAASRGASAVIPNLSEQQEDELPAGTAVVLTALGRVNEPSVMRTVMAYEAHWVKRRASLGPLYRGLRQPSMQARIIAVARSFNDMLTPAPGVVPPSADEAIARLEADAKEPSDRTALRLLIGALGLFPTGTLIELSTGEVAVVVQTPQHPSLYSQPRVRIILDASGGARDRPLEIDLAAQQRRRSSEPVRLVRRVVATSDDTSAASLRAMAAGPATPEASLPGASGIRSPGESTAPPPSSTDSSRPRVPDSRNVTIASQFTVRSTPPPPAPLAPLDVDRRDPSTRAVTWEEQASLVEKESALLEAEAASAPGEAMAPSMAPTAEGTIARTPFIHLLIYMLDQRLTGTTVLRLPNGTSHAIYFMEGAPSKVRTGAMIAPLDRIILEKGLLDEATLRSSLIEVSKRQILHGRHLVMKGLLDRETVIDLLRVQVLRKITHLFELPPETTYAYFENHNLLATYGGPELTPCEPLAAIMAGIRERASDPLVDATLQRIAGRPLSLHVDADLRRFQLQREERAVVDLIRSRRMTLSELLAADVAPPRTVRLLIYALTLTRHLDLGGGRTPVGIHREWTAAVEQQPQQAPPPPSPQAQARTHDTVPAMPAARARAGAQDTAPVISGSRARTGTLNSETSIVDAEAPPPRAPRGDGPILRPTTKISQAEPILRPTTPRMPRVAGAPRSPEPPSVTTSTTDGEALPPASASPASASPSSVAPRSVPGVASWMNDPPPISRPTTRMPRVSVPNESIDVLDDPTPPSRRGPSPSWAPPPSSVRSPPPSARSYEWSSGGTITPPSPGVVVPVPASPSVPVDKSPIAPPAVAFEKPPSSPPMAADKPPTPPPLPPRKPPIAPPAPPAPPLPADRPSALPRPPIAPPVAAPPLPADRPSSLPRPPPKPPLKPRPTDNPITPPAVVQPVLFAPPPPPLSPTQPSSPDMAARRAEIERRSKTIDAEDYFQMLGVGRDATSEQVRNAYFALARKWHPDRLPAELADLKPALARVFARINDAYQALSDADKRKEYVAKPNQGGAADEDAKIARVVDAALEFQKAEILLKKNDLAGAESLAARAADADPEQPEYKTLLVWIQALRRGEPPVLKEGTTSAHFDDLIGVLDEVLTKEPRYERALYYRGVLHKRAGRADKAIRDFKLVAEINPKNIDAVREVRLHDMRSRANPTPATPDGGGLFGKFWKR